MICLTCGKTITTPLARECPFCHAPIAINNVTNAEAVKKMDHLYDCKDNRLLWLSVFLFPYGLYFFLRNKEEYPMRSSSALGGALMGLVLVCMIITVIVVMNIV